MADNDFQPLDPEKVKRLLANLGSIAQPGYAAETSPGNVQSTPLAPVDSDSPSPALRADVRAAGVQGGDVPTLPDGTAITDDPRGGRDYAAMTDDELLAEHKRQSGIASALDYSKMTDDDLMAEYQRQSGSAPAPDYSKMTDDQLKALLAQQGGTDYANMPWGEVASRGAGALPGSVWDNTVGAVKAIINDPKGTVDNLGRLATGVEALPDYAVSKVAQMLAPNSDKVKALAQANSARVAPVLAVARDYGDTYLAKGGLKRTLATDPGRILLDASTALDGAGVAARSVGLAKTASLLDKVAAVTNPTAVAAKGGQLALRGAGNTIKAGEALLSGVPMAAQDAIRNEAMTGGRAVWDATKGGVDNEGLADAARTAAGKAAAANSAERGAAGAAWQNIPTVMDHQPMLDAVDKAIEETKTAGGRVWDKPTHNRLQEMKTEIEDAFTTPGDVMDTNTTDKLKQGLYDIANRDGLDANGSRLTNGVVEAARQHIESMVPRYAEDMAKYGNNAEAINNARSVLGLDKATISPGTIAKRLFASQQKLGGSQFKNAVGTLLDADPSFRDQVVGATARGIIPTNGIVGRIIHSRLAHYAALGGAGGLAALPAAAVTLLKGAPLLVASSPAVVRYGQRAAGTALRYTPSVNAIGQAGKYANQVSRAASVGPVPMFNPDAIRRKANGQ